MEIAAVTAVEGNLLFRLHRVGWGRNCSIRTHFGKVPLPGRKGVFDQFQDLVPPGVALRGADDPRHGVLMLRDALEEGLNRGIRLLRRLFADLVKTNAKGTTNLIGVSNIGGVGCLRSRAKRFIIAYGRFFGCCSKHRDMSKICILSDNPGRANAFSFCNSSSKGG